MMCSDCTRVVIERGLLEKFQHTMRMNVLPEPQFGSHHIEYEGKLLCAKWWDDVV